MIWITLGLAVLAGFLVYWVVSSEIADREAWNREAYIRALERMMASRRQHRISEDDFTEKWSD